eukprot:2307621-Amphidinium_carterae.1
MKTWLVVFRLLSLLQEFATTEGDFNLSSLDGPFAGAALPIGTQLNIWTWSRTQARMHFDFNALLMGLRFIVSGTQRTLFIG